MAEKHEAKLVFKKGGRVAVRTMDFEEGSKPKDLEILGIKFVANDPYPEFGLLVFDLSTEDERTFEQIVDLCGFTEETKKSDLVGWGIEVTLSDRF